MRQRNRLYTVNRFNKPAFVDRTYQNIFDGFGQTSLLNPNTNSSEFWSRLGVNTQLNNPQGQVGNAAAAQTLANFAPASNAVSNPFSFKEAFSSAGLKNGLKASAGAAVGLGADIVGGLAGNAISGGLKSGVGSAIGTIGGAAASAIGSVNPLLGAAVGVGSKILGGVTNALFGTKVDQEKLSAANEGTAAYSNFNSNATNFDNISGPIAQAGIEDAYSGGLFKKGWARKRNEELKRQRADARLLADRSVLNNIGNLADDQMNDALYNYAAYGGPLDFGGGALGLMQQNRYFDTIDKRSEAIAGKGQNMQTGFTGGAKTFAGGGLKAAFLDEFGSDPIGAAVRYNQGLEQLAAQEEAKQIEAAMEQEYADMQKRLFNLETENQGLQSLMAAQPQNPLPMISEIPAFSSTPSRAAYNSNWDYIEDQLKRSGKFNDIQIEGIKYNLQRESGIGQYDNGDNGTARGIAQWRGERIPSDMSLEGQTQYLIDTLSNYDGRLHWIGEDNYRGFMNARTPEEAHYYIARGYERPHKDIVAKVKRDSDMSLKRLKALGGNIEEPQDNTRVSKPTILPTKRERGFSDSEYFWNSGLQYPAGLWRHKDGTFHTSDSYGNDIMLTQEEADSIVRTNKEKDKKERIRRVIEERRKSNALAFGGELGTNGTDFTNGLLYIDEGGSHEDNPLDGVPMGLDPQGIPNLVEEGETVYNDYVFSDRMKVPFFMYKELGLGGVVKKKGKEMSFADASKKLAQESEQRPNDPLSQDGLQASLSRLAEVQETERAKKNMEEYVGLEGYALGGNMYGYGGKTYNGKKMPPRGTFETDSSYARKLENAGFSDLDIDTIILGESGKNNTFTYSPRTKTYKNKMFQKADGSPMYSKKEIDEEQKAFRYGRYQRVPSEIKTANKPEQTAQKAASNSANKQKTVKYRDNAGNLHDTRQEALVANDTARRQRLANRKKQEGVQNNPVNTSAGDSSESTVNTGRSKQRSSNYNFGAAQPSASVGLSGVNPYPTSAPYPIQSSRNPIGAETQGLSALAEAAGITNQEARDLGIEDIARRATQGIEERMIAGDKNYYPTWMRYAPAVGSGIMALTDALGLTNKPDYTYADKIEAAAQNAGYAPNISYNPIGDYMRYNPMDIWYQQNALNAQSRATDRALLNTSSPSKAAGLLANGYNSQLASGNLYRQALEYNDENRKQVADFNRKTNMFNSQMGLEAAMANARYHQAAQQMGLSGLAQAAALRDSIDSRVGAARSANITNFLESLGNIGRENFAMNQINDDDAYYYGVDSRGRTPFKGARRKCGGKINRRK